MSALKAHQVAGFLKKPSKNNGIFLIYGSDQGQIYEISKKLISYFEKNINGGLEIITFECDDILADPTILSNEAHSIPMFGGIPCIRVRNVKKSLAPTIKLLAEQPLKAIIILEAGNLAPRDSLRASLEKSSNAITLPCYADNIQNLNSFIRQSFIDANISIDQEAISTLGSFLGNDREITNREIEKLTLFALESKTINAKDIIMLCGDNSALMLDSIADNAGTGRVDLLDKNIKQAFDSNIDPQRILIVTLLHFSWLRKLHAQMQSENITASNILQKQRPKPHFSRINSLEQQLRLWNDNRLASATNRIYQAIADTRKTTSINTSITHRALIAIGVAAAHY